MLVDGDGEQLQCDVVALLLCQLFCNGAMQSNQS
jgi:hypothetical protein